MDDSINLFTFKGYHKRYCEYIGQGYVGRVAWEKTEDEYQELTRGVEKYSSFESWQGAMYRKLKKK